MVHCAVRVPLGHGLPRFCRHAAGVAGLGVLLALVVETGLSVTALLMTAPLIVVQPIGLFASPLTVVLDVRVSERAAPALLSEATAAALLAGGAHTDGMSCSKKKIALIIRAGGGVGLISPFSATRTRSFRRSDREPAHGNQYPSTAAGRTEAGDRHLDFHETRDNLT
jgi:hypothetical protein